MHTPEFEARHSCTCIVQTKLPHKFRKRKGECIFLHYKRTTDAYVHNHDIIAFFNAEYCLSSNRTAPESRVKWPAFTTFTEP